MVGYDRETCFGRDIRVELPVCEFCLPNEIIIDETVRGIVFRDFDIKSIDVKTRPLEHQPTKIEEELTVYGLGELKTEAAAGSEAPEYFVYALGIIGKLEEAKKVAQQVSERLGDEATKLGSADDEHLQRILRTKTLNYIFNARNSARLAIEKALTL